MTNPFVPKPHPAYQAIFDMMKQANIKLQGLDPVTIRGYQAAAPKPPGYSVPDTLVEERDIPVGDHDIKLFCVRPPGTENDILPGFVFIHGGGFVLSNFKTHEKLAKEICVNAHVAVLFVEYTLAPERKFPSAPEECYEAVLWIKEHAAALKVDDAKIVMGGDSAGGNLTAGTALMLKERGHPDVLKGQILVYPSVHKRSVHYDSYDQFGGGDYFMSKEDSAYFQSFYLPDPSNPPEDIRYTPNLATDEQLTGLPRTLLITAECDILRDGAEHYAQRLTQVGVETCCMRMIGGVHGFASFPVSTGIYRQTMNAIASFTNECFE
ncbi:hypothetical protein DM01DRAFT_1386921 [Hesseltinella vesiculosa]|uniref:Alpha/beta hydrolase fold-3 domain-containing protein n=1 Tax=Hesseltinella vesiculosa TaxID=101127 RepID=A0A1X2G577_9FUNG|nr:hypothetical protein DM01DRAFT_1386921 [Hesseltinella vesiculosa]